MRPRWLTLTRGGADLNSPTSAGLSFVAVNLDHVAVVKVTPEHVTMHLESGHILVVENEPRLQERLATLIQVDGVVLPLDTVKAAILSA